jgi:WD40 repeat protein
MHKLFKRVDPPSSGSPSPVTAPGGKQDYSEDEEFFDSKPMNDDDVSSIGTRRTITTTNGKRVVVGDSTAKSGSESEGGHKTPRGYSSEEFQNSHPPKSTTSSGKRSVTESSYPDDEQYETCEDQSVKDARPVIMPRTSPDESRYYSDTGSSSYTQLKNFKGLSSSILSSTKPRSMSIDDQMSQVSSLSSMSMEPATVPLTGLAFVQLNMNNGGGNNGTGGTGTRHNSQDTEPSYALSALQDEVGASSGVEEDDDQQSVDKDSVQNTVTEQKEDDNSRIGTNSNVKTSESTNNGTTENGQHPKMQAEDEKRIMLALFSLHPSSLQQQQQMDETAAFRLSNSTNTSENQFYTKNIKVTSTMPDNRACLFKEKLRLVQSLKPHDGSIWTMKFSPNGHYLASGGQDMKVMVWAVGKLPTDTNNDTDHEDWPPEDDDLDDDQKATSSNSGGLGIDQFVCPDPYRIFEGHSGDVIDISWSKSNFILSASMDLTVRLWHVTRNDCLQHFRHPDVVTCVEFHPTIDRYFITGCFDRRLRVWDIIPDGTVKEWVQATDTVSTEPVTGFLSCRLYHSLLFV